MEETDCFFEISWEVCNKVGGIYTVIASKAPHMMEQYKNYYLIGPYAPKKAAVDFQQAPPPEHFKEAFAALKEEGIECYFGKWAIKGKPFVILIDPAKFLQNKPGIKGHLWETFQVDSLFAGLDFDEPVVWGWAVGKVIEKLLQNWGCPQVVIQAHEWLSGSALLYCKDKKVPVATVFTTHATVLGRTLAGSNQPLYDILDTLNPDEEAKKHNVAAKHSLEKASALATDVFTTVSEITGVEAEKILGRKPDVLLPNGLDFGFFPDLEQIPARHAVFKRKIQEFIRPFFFPYYHFKLDKTLFFYLSGRFEMHNKGIDVFIDALGRLNNQLKEAEADLSIVVFIFVPAGWRSIKLSLLESKSLFEDIQDSIDDYMPILRRKIVSSVAHRKMPDEAKIFGEDFLHQMKKSVVSFSKEGTPPLCTHELDNGSDVENRLRSNGLDNGEEQRVKVIFYPSYLSSSDGLLDMDYYPAVWGCHLGIFPSYYEPWGYTPMESAAYGVPSITSDLSGFGIYLEKTNKEDVGIQVLHRKGRSYEDVVTDLAKMMFDFANLPKQERIQKKIDAEHFVRKLSWANLIENYVHAHQLALKKT